MKASVAEQLQDYGFRPKKRTGRYGNRMKADEPREVMKVIEPDFSHAPTFSKRVQDAKARLTAGEDPAEIRHEHGGVVLKIAREILNPGGLR